METQTNFKVRRKYQNIRRNEQDKLATETFQFCIRSKLRILVKRFPIPDQTYWMLNKIGLALLFKIGILLHDFGQSFEMKIILFELEGTVLLS